MSKNFDSLDTSNKNKILLNKIRQELSNNGYKNVSNFYTDAYLLNVFSAPNRPFDYALDKIKTNCQWRIKENIDHIHYNEIQNNLSWGSMYWYGYDYLGHPILWIRPKLKKYDIIAKNRMIEIKAHIYLIEKACTSFMSSTISSFIIIADATNLGFQEMDIILMKMLVNICVKHYPDRIYKIYIGPMNTVIRILTSILVPLLPNRLRDKLILMNNTNIINTLKNSIPINFIPDYLGGNTKHMLSLEMNNNNNNNNKFDMEYMTKQQLKMLEEYNNENKVTN